MRALLRGYQALRSFRKANVQAFDGFEPSADGLPMINERLGKRLRSDAMDQLLSTFLKQPAKVSWRGALGDSVRGVFEGARLELAGVSVLALPFDRLVFESERFQFMPGIPAKFDVVKPRLEISIDQRQIDRWLAQARAPFALELRPDGIEFQLNFRGVMISKALTTLEIVNGWLALKPKRAEILGLDSRMAHLFRSYLPIPRLARHTRLTAIRHTAGAIRLELSLDDFEEEITPGLVDRLQKRFLPFASVPGSVQR